MTTPRSHAAAATLLVAALTSCTAASPPLPVAPLVTAPVARDSALDVYREFWRITDAARAAPRAEDWTPQIEAVAGGQALQTALTDVRNYASLPAHTVGTISRTPAVASESPTTVSIVDCVDLGDSRLISDTDGSVLDDVGNKVQRFRLRADVVTSPDGRWLVQAATPALSETC